MCESVSYKINIGGRELGPVIPTRGLRQGDPLSPYLFIICAEGFLALLSDFEKRGRLQGCKVARGAPSISHMFFADDSYLFCKATEGSANSVVELLSHFQLASGQQVNFNKSSVFFSSNTGPAMRTNICSILKIGEAGNRSTYLGLPNILGEEQERNSGFLKGEDEAKDPKLGGKTSF